MWQVDFKKLVAWLCPVVLQQPNTLLLLLAANYPVRNNYNLFIQFVAATQYRLSHNSQVCYLRAVLNDAFDFSDRRIRIVDFEGLEAVYLWPDADQRDIDITDDSPTYLWPDDAYTDSGIDFTIQIPAGICTSASDLAYLASLMNTYKTPGKNYNIQRI